MKQSLLLLMVLIGMPNIFSQNSSFEKGYFIDASNKKTECLIRNKSWDYNPQSIDYKLDENSKTETLLFPGFNEFAVGNEAKYIKANVKIDKSSDELSSFTAGDKTVKCEDAVLLLKVLVEGDVSLYSYATTNYLRFFYSKNDGQILPLTYKVYYHKESEAYRNNDSYKQELYNVLVCDKIGRSDFEKLEYKKDAMVNVFLKYNSCKNAKTNAIKAVKNHNTLEFYAKAGLGISNLSYRSNGDENIDFGNKVKFKVGFEVEVNLSNKFKNWSILVEPVYHTYSSSHTYSNNTTLDIAYKAVDLSLGIRKYFLISPKSLVFVNAYYTQALSTGSKFGSGMSSLEIENSQNTSVGLGYMYNKKYTVELRYEFGRDLFSN